MPIFVFQIFDLLLRSTPLHYFQQELIPFLRFESGEPQMIIAFEMFENVSVNATSTR